MEVHTCREQIGIAPQAERRQIAAIASAPQSDAFCVDIAGAQQIFARRHHVLIFRRATPSAALGFSKRPAVADPAAIIQRQDNVSAAHEVLIHRIGIRVVVHVVPAEEHLPHRPAVQKNQRGTFLARFDPGRQKKLRV